MKVVLSHISHMPKHTPEETILYYARVSNSDGTVSKRPSNLLKYLIAHEHWSPFEMVSMCLEIKTDKSSGIILSHSKNSLNDMPIPFLRVLTGCPENHVFRIKLTDSLHSHQKMLI